MPDSIAATDSFSVPPPAPPDTVRAQDAAPGEEEKALVSADSLSALVREGERLQELFDNVSVTQDTTRLRSNFALRYLQRDELLFTGDVVIYERGDTLRADTVRYNKRTKVGRARGNVRLTDGEVVVRASRATYYTEEKRSVFPDSVTLVDSTRVLRAQSGTYWSNERRADFQGHVRLTDPETYLEADSLTYFRDTERSIAEGRVFIRREETRQEGEESRRPDSTLTDSTVTVRRDTTSRTYLFGNWVDNQEQRRYSRVEGNALLVRVRMDTTGAPEDTLAVRAQQLEAIRTDTYRRLVAVDSVRIWQADLAAVADSAVYDRVVAAGTADTAQTPAPLPDTTTAPSKPQRRYPTRLDSLVAETVPRSLLGPRDPIRGQTDPPSGPPQADTTVTATRPARSPTPDSISQSERQRRLAPDPQSMRGRGGPETSTYQGRRVWDRPVARSAQDVPLEETRLFESPVTWFEQSQVWGDSIRVRAYERSLDTVFVRGAAFAAQQDTTLDRIQQLKGKDITAFFQSDSLRRIQAQPNAQAIRFFAAKDSSLKGAAKASGDRIVLRFRNGQMKRTSVIGGVQSSYYRKPEDIPDPFELQGFQWTPERKPTKRGLLRVPRVREQLELQKRRSPPLARQGQAEGGQARGAGRQRGPLDTRPDLQRAEPTRQPYRPDSLSVRPDSIQDSTATQYSRPPESEAVSTDSTATLPDSNSSQ